MAGIDVECVLSKLALPEKVELLSGIDVWHTKAIPRLGLPSLRFSDGPNGVRGPKNFNSVPAACFPCGTALGATWDVELLREAGTLMAEEAKAKGAHVILGPCINIQRSPLGGRGFESLSEDPVLAGAGAAAIINGIEKEGIVATIKHFVCNDQEHGRILFDALVTERALREIYLLPFQIAVRDSNPGCFMTSYNKLNGIHVSESKLIEDTLRGEWGWSGLVMSDWLGTYSTSRAINTGLDLEMPGPTRWRGPALAQAVSANKVTPFTIDERVRNVLNLVKRCEKSGVKENQQEVSRNLPGAAALIRKIAAESIVLLKNGKSVLPLSKDKSVLMIGPNVKISVYCGGGSSFITPYYAVTPFEGVQAKVKDQNVAFTVGAHSHKWLPLIGQQVFSKGKLGVSFRSYNDPPTVKDRELADELHITNTHMLLLDYKCLRLNGPLWYADIEGMFTADDDGTYEFGLCVYGAARLYVDGKMIIDNETKQTQGTVFFGCGTVEEKGTVDLAKGQSCNVKVEFTSAPACKLGAGGVTRYGGGGVRIGLARKIDPKEEILKAAELARNAEQVVICTGLNGDWEAEGSDRQNMDLPGYTNELVSAVLGANPNTVIVMQSGTPVEMPWAKDASTMLQAWYGGNETGNAIADILFGDVNPSARLPLSFPIKVKDNPAYLNFRCEGGRTLYGEDVYVGYRYYDTIGKEVLFPFGHGLSYSTFVFSDLRIVSDDAQVNITISVTNLSKVAGSEVVQIYVSQKSPSIRRPVKELKGFKKVHIKADTKETVTIEIDTKYATSFWDEIRKMWISERDVYEVIISNGTDVRLRGDLEVHKTTWWKGL